MLIGDPLRQHDPGPPGQVPRRRPDPADVLSRPGLGGRFDPKTGDSFVFSKDIGGNELFQLYRYDFADGKATLLTDGKSRNTGATWSNGGQWIAYGSTRRTGNDVDIYVVDAAGSRSRPRLLEVSGGGWQVRDWSPDDTKLLSTECISINESYLWLADVATGAKTALTPKGGKEKVAYRDGVVLARTARASTSRLDAGSEFRRLAYVDLRARRRPSS